MSKREIQIPPLFEDQAQALFPFAYLSNYVGFGRSRIYDLIARDGFPAPIKIGKSSRWVKSEIDTWLSKKIATRQSLKAAR